MHQFKVPNPFFSDLLLRASNIRGTKSEHNGFGFFTESHIRARGEKRERPAHDPREFGKNLIGGIHKPLSTQAQPIFRFSQGNNAITRIGAEGIQGAYREIRP